MSEISDVPCTRVASGPLTVEGTLLVLAVEIEMKASDSPRHLRRDVLVVTDEGCTGWLWSDCLREGPDAEDPRP